VAVIAGSLQVLCQIVPPLFILSLLTTVAGKHRNERREDCDERRIDRRGLYRRHLGRHLWPDDLVLAMSDFIYGTLYGAGTMLLGFVFGFLAAVIHQIMADSRAIEHENK
jgi:hypothetical protein